MTGAFLSDPLRRTSLLGSLAGVCVGWLLWWLILVPLAPLGESDPVAEALVALLPTAVLVLAMTLTVSLTRFVTKAVDALVPDQPRLIDVTNRVLSNTVEQLTAFLPAVLILSLTAQAAFIPHLNGLCWLFALSRLAFWIGYVRWYPMGRAPGMALTFTVTAAAIAWAGWIVLMG